MALKDHVVRVEGEVEKGERDRKHILLLKQENSQQLQVNV